MMCQKFPDVGPKCHGTRGGRKSEGLQSFIAKEQSYKPYSAACLDVDLSCRGTKDHKIREQMLRRRLCMDLSGVFGLLAPFEGSWGALTMIQASLFAFWAPHARQPPNLLHTSEEDLMFMREDGFTKARAPIFER